MQKVLNPNHFITMYLLGYAFYTYQVLTQLLYAYCSLGIIIPSIIFFLLFPLIILYITKTIDKHPKYSSKIRFFINTLSCIYFFAINIIILHYAAVMIHNYYYQNLQCYTIAFFLLIPLLYVSLKKASNYYALSSIFLFIFFAFKIIYLIGHSTTDLYPLINIFNISNPFLVVILTLPILIEPFLIFASSNKFDHGIKVKVKPLTVIAIMISLFGIYTLIRETMEFGLLLDTMSFPYFESYKYISIRTNFDNVDYFYLFSITLSLFTRIPISFFLIKDNININKKWTFIYYSLVLVTFYYLQLKLEFYTNFITPFLITLNIILLTIAILTLFYKRRKKYAN